MRIEPLSTEHNRFIFTCGNEKLDRYLHEIAHQAKRKGTAATFVAILPEEPGKILGYYSLSNYMISGIEIPDLARRKQGLPKHSVGATLLGRLAVSMSSQGSGVGKMLLMDALCRSYRVSGDVASACVVVDAIDVSSIPFYEKFGFVRANSEGLRLVLMMSTIAELLPGISNSASREGTSGS